MENSERAYIYRNGEEEHTVIFLEQGMEVVHSRFGLGKVMMFNDEFVVLIWIDEERPWYHERKILLRKFADLKTNNKV
jgi:hypothetical protein